MNIVNDTMQLQLYRLAFKHGAIGGKDADYYISLLSENTLNYISNNSFDKRLIKPIMKMALETADKGNGIQEFDKIVNSILNNKREMFILMNTFCH